MNIVVRNGRLIDPDVIPPGADKRHVGSGDRRHATVGTAVKLHFEFIREGRPVQLVILDVPILLPQVKSGKLRALAIATGKRAPTLPETPTTAEGGFPKVLSDNWYGLVGPAGLPGAVQKRLHAAAIAALNTAELVENYAKVSGVPMPSSPEEYAVYLAQEQKKWGAVVKAIGFKAE